MTLINSGLLFNYTGIEYNWDFAIYSVGAYSGVFVLFLWLFGGTINRGSPESHEHRSWYLVLLAAYGLLPESIRFSRQFFYQVLPHSPSLLL